MQLLQSVVVVAGLTAIAFGKSAEGSRPWLLRCTSCQLRNTGNKRKCTYWDSFGGEITGIGHTKEYHKETEWAAVGN